MHPDEMVKVLWADLLAAALAGRAEAGIENAAAVAPTVAGRVIGKLAEHSATARATLIGWLQPLGWDAARAALILVGLA